MDFHSKMLKVTNVQTFIMNLCDGPLWDTNLTWYTDDPDFTPCFHKLVLSSAPTVFLLLFLPLQIFFAYNSKGRTVPWGKLNIVKIFLQGNV